jgi:ABC-type transporter Mla MlaB component
MLRIIATYQLAAETGAALRLELKGRLEGDCVDELRRTWRPLRAAIAEVPVSVAVSEVEFVDAAGKVLLAEMHRAGVDVARGEATVQPWCAFSRADHDMGTRSTMSVAG